jgi:hypothetical protein
MEAADSGGEDDGSSGCWMTDSESEAQLTASIAADALNALRDDSSDGSDDDEEAETPTQRSGCGLNLSAAELQPLLCEWNGLPGIDAAASCSRLSVFQQPRFDCLQAGQLPVLLLPFTALRELEIVHQG